MKPLVVLLQWQFLQLSGITVLALLITGGWVLFHKEPNEELYAMGLIISLHSQMAATTLGQFYTGEFGFLHGRGFSREQLWWSTTLASFLAAGAVWLLLAGSVWLGLRSLVQSALLNNPEYPVMAPLDNAQPWAWLTMYVFAQCSFQYAWIRGAQPMRGKTNGVWLACGGIGAACILIPAGNRGDWVARLILGSALLLCVILLVAQYRLYRSLEVRG